MSYSQSPPGYLEQYCGDRLVHISVACIPVEVVFVALRYIAQRIRQAPVGLDDILILPALVFCLGVNACAISMVKYAGVGYHLIALKRSDPGKIVLWSKFLIAAPVLYFIAVVLPKLVILNIYLHIFSLKSYRITTYLVAGILIAGATANVLVAIFECTPVSYYWDKSIAGGRCIDTNAYFRWSTLLNIITDVVLLIMPLPVVWRLQMSRNIKVGLTLTFLTGSIGLVTSIIRLASFFTTDAVTDGTWASVNLMTWTVLEPGVYLIAACLLTYRPLFAYLKRHDPLSSLHLGRDRHNHSETNREHETGGIPLAPSKGSAQED